MHKISVPEDKGYPRPEIVSHLMRDESFPDSLEMAIVHLVSNNARVPSRMILHPSRCRAHIARARQLAMYLLHVSAGRNMAEIAELFGRDRTTVSHACGRVEDRRDCPEFDAFVSRLERAVDALVLNRGDVEMNESQYHACR